MLKALQTSVILQRLASTSINASSSTTEPDKLFKRIELEVRGHDKAVLQSYMTFVHVSYYNMSICFILILNLECL